MNSADNSLKYNKFKYLTLQLVREDNIIKLSDNFFNVFMNSDEFLNCINTNVNQTALDAFIAAEMARLPIIKNKLIILIFDYNLVSNFSIKQQLDIISYFHHSSNYIFYLYVQSIDQKIISLCNSLSIKSDNIISSGDFFNQSFEMIFHFKIKNALQWDMINTNLHAAQKNVRQLHQLSISDELTGLYNMRYFKDCLVNNCKNALDHSSSSMAVIMLDVDFFKSVNDKISHLAGSKVLSTIGQIILDNLRQFDVAARFGGDEFIIILNHTKKSGAKTVCQRLIEKISAHEFIFDNKKLQISLSAGVAYLQDCQKNFKKDNYAKKLSDYQNSQLIDLLRSQNNYIDSSITSKALNLISYADKNLYLAKKGGRARFNIGGECFLPQDSYGNPIAITNIKQFESI